MVCGCQVIFRQQHRQRDTQQDKQEDEKEERQQDGQQEEEEDTDRKEEDKEQDNEQDDERNRQQHSEQYDEQDKQKDDDDDDGDEEDDDDDDDDDEYGMRTAAESLISRLPSSRLWHRQYDDQHQTIVSTFILPYICVCCYYAALLYGAVLWNASVSLSVRPSFSSLPISPERNALVIINSVEIFRCKRTSRVYLKSAPHHILKLIITQLLLRLVLGLRLVLVLVCVITIANRLSYVVKHSL